MATHRMSIIGPNLALDAGTFPDLIANQITAAAAPPGGGAGSWTSIAGDGFR